MKESVVSQIRIQQLLAISVNSKSDIRFSAIAFD